MKYSVIRDVMKQINDCSGGIYYYLTSQDGEMIYHPRGTELNRGLFEENSLDAAKYEDGTYEIRSRIGLDIFRETSWFPSKSMTRRTRIVANT